MASSIKTSVNISSALLPRVIRIRIIFPSARICQKVVEIARAEGIKLGLLRPITLWPFPTKVIAAYADKEKVCYRLS